MITPRSGAQLKAREPPGPVPTRHAGLVAETFWTALMTQFSRIMRDTTVCRRPPARRPSSRTEQAGEGGDLGSTPRPPLGVGPPTTVPTPPTVGLHVPP